MWSLGGTCGEHGQVVVAAADGAVGRRRVPDEELELAVAGGHGDVLVLHVPEVAEHVADGDHLPLEADEVDVAVLALGELEVDGVVAHGEPAGEPKDDAVAALPASMMAWASAMRRS